MLSYLLLSFAFCQPPPVPVPAGGAKASILDRHGNPPPSEIPCGEFISFSGAKALRGPNTVSILVPTADGKQVLEKLPSGLLWMVEPPERRARAEKSDDGIILYVGTGLVDCDLKITQVAAKGESADVQTVTVRITGRGPRPPPGPDPVPPPPPTDVSKTSRDEAMKIPQPARAKAAAVATALRAAQQTVMDNAMTQAAGVMTLIRSKTNAALGDSASAWKDWGIAVALKMRDANPMTPTAWAKLIEQAADGLGAVQ